MEGDKKGSEKMKKELLHKPNQLIMMTNGDISVNQRKAYNVILFQAREELLKNNKQTEFIFSISDLKKSAGINATNNKELKEDLTKLKRVDVEVMKNGGEDWSIFNLLSEATKEGDQLLIELPRTIRKALIENSYYTTLDLLTLKNFTSKYAVIIYEMALRYKGKEIPFLTLEEFKQLTGTKEVKSYNNFGLLKNKVITPALTEINEKTEYKIDYDLKRSGRKVTGIKFKLEKLKKAPVQQIKDVPPVKYKGKAPEEVTEEIKEPISQEIKQHKKDILKLAEAQLPRPQFNIFKTTIGMVRTKDQINNLVMEFNINMTL